MVAHSEIVAMTKEDSSASDGDSDGFGGGGDCDIIATIPTDDMSAEKQPVQKTKKKILKKKSSDASSSSSNSDSSDQSDNSILKLKLKKKKTKTSSGSTSSSDSSAGNFEGLAVCPICDKPLKADQPRYRGKCKIHDHCGKHQRKFDYNCKKAGGKNHAKKIAAMKMKQPKEYKKRFSTWSVLVLRPLQSRRYCRTRSSHVFEPSRPERQIRMRWSATLSTRTTAYAASGGTKRRSFVFGKRPRTTRLLLV